MIKWFSHASFLFEGSKIIYTDPWELKRSELKADMILITHDHFDHCAPGDVERVSKPSTVVVAPADCIKKLEVGGLKLEMRAVKPGETVTVADVKIEAVPAYNVNKQFHPKVNNWVGYIFTLDGERIYQAGDTDAVPEMNDIKADMVILPVGGTYTMTAEEAAGVVNKINPKLAIPMHFGKIVGSEEDAEKFKKLAMCEVQILKPE